MKAIRNFLFILCTLSLYNTLANSFTVGSISYQFLSDSTVSIIQANANYIPSSVMYNGKLYSVTAIERCAFAYNMNLENITIPNSITYIGAYAFEFCIALESITIGKNVNTIDTGAFRNCYVLQTINYKADSCGGFGFGYDSNFSYGNWLEGCDNLEIVNIGNNVKVIPANFIKGKEKVTSITIPNSVNKIDFSAFKSCKGLTTIVIPNNVSEIENQAFAYCINLSNVVIYNGIKIISTNLFCGCTGLTNITIPNSVKSIESSAFEGCTGLTNISMPNSVKFIGDRAFYGCTKLTKINLSDSLNTIEANAFNQTGLTSIVVPRSTTTIYIGAFNGLDNIIVDSNNTKFASDNGLLYNKEYTKIICTPSNFKGKVTIKDSTLYIGKYAFCNCKTITNVSLPNSIIEIDTCAFLNCTGITDIQIPNNVMKINSGAFYDCINLKTITIGKSVLYIGDNVFYGCNILDSIIMLGMPPQILSTTFGTISYNMPIMVPCGLSYTYSISEIWNYFQNYKEVFPHILECISIDTLKGEVYVSKESTCYDTEAKIEAAAVKGYHFSEWNDGNTDNPRSVVVTQDTSFTAYFEIDTFFISVLSNDNIAGTTDGSGIYDYNSEVVISASANKHYHFVSWSDGNTSNPRIVTIDKDSVFTALFEEDNKYHIQVISSNNTMGTTEGEGVYYEGEQVQIKAVANEHYIFKEWSDGNTSNPRTITVLSDNVYIANFEKESSLQDVTELPQIQIYPNPVKDVVFIENVVCSTEYITINIYDNKGGLVLTETIPNATSYILNTTLLKSGVYYLRLVGVENSRVFKLIKE